MKGMGDGGWEMRILEEDVGFELRERSDGFQKQRDILRLCRLFDSRKIRVFEGEKKVKNV